MRTAVFGVCLVMLIAGQGLAGTRDVVTCDIQNSPCAFTLASGTEVVLSISPRPVKVMQNVEFVVTLRNRRQPVTGAHLHLDLSMPGMFMGSNQPKLKEEMPGSYRGSGVFPRCASGQRSWKASLAVSHGGRVETAAFIFEVQ